MVTSTDSSPTPNYIELVRFLIEPFLEVPDSLRVDCEVSASRPRVWIRVAFEASDRGRVFGRGGRNIQAIRLVVESVATLSGQTASLDVHGESVGGDRGDRGGSNGDRSSPEPHMISKKKKKKPSPRRVGSEKPSLSNTDQGDTDQVNTQE